MNTEAKRPGKLRKNLVRSGWIAAVLVLVGCLLLALKSPRDDRNWKPEHSRVPLVERDGNLIRVQNVRNFRVAADGTDLPAYDDRTYDLNELNSLWYVLAVFHEDDFRGPAHSMFSFGFADSSYVVISVEARKEVGESYSIWKGMLKTYEMIYIVGDERDLILTRAVHRTDHVYLYPVQVAPDKIRQLFVEMLKQGAQLKTHPEFYNTLTNNCTTRLRDHVNQLVPGLIPMSWKIQLPGYSDELARDLGLIDDTMPLEKARERFCINERARLYASDPAFSTRIRSGASLPAAR